MSCFFIAALRAQATATPGKWDNFGFASFHTRMNTKRTRHSYQVMAASMAYSFQSIHLIGDEKRYLSFREFVNDERIHLRIDPNGATLTVSMRESGFPCSFKMEVFSDFKPMFRYKIGIDIVRVAGRQSVMSHFYRRGEVPYNSSKLSSGWADSGQGSRLSARWRKRKCSRSCLP